MTTPFPAPYGAAPLELLGGFRLWQNGNEVSLPSGAQRVVAVLALRGRMGRSRLAGTLWPDAEEDRANGRLRTAIWRVNRCAPGTVRSRGRDVGLAASVDSDVGRLAAASRAVLEGAAPEPDVWWPEGPRGELLPDWDDEWLVEDRERLHQIRLHTLQAVAEECAANGRYGLAVDAALAVLRSDPVRESAYRTLMRVHLAEGNRGEACRTYARCADVLERELGVRPQTATTALLSGTAAYDPSPA